MSISSEERIKRKTEWFYNKLLEQSPSAAGICFGQRYHDELYKDAITNGGCLLEDIENAVAARDAYRRYGEEIGVDWKDNSQKREKDENVLLLRPPLRKVTTCSEYGEV